MTCSICKGTGEVPMLDGGLMPRPKGMPTPMMPCRCVLVVVDADELEEARKDPAVEKTIQEGRDYIERTKRDF